ncbi:Smr/MutS family protein [Sphingomonas sp. PR090111-T3T-6A]|uniref:Smr/MutS family protein n=1 Tax=Sphingomonas sp. PR090111-T3T-6A TaxID=685778 RepID=UPI0003814B32|nr:Smr/MutS family protein [Sphingomonas sp. PR090111-T3T-6A]
MPDKPLDPEARALWQRVAETVRPLKGRRLLRKAALPAVSVEKPIPVRAPTPKPIAKATTPGDTLDAGWDRRLRRGVVGPDLTIDLHGYTLTAAHEVLEAELGRAIQRHARLVLLVTGRPPRDSTERIDGRPVRGAIRASIGDWLHHSRHASHIAAVRSAHPRHGGAGALYVVLRRTRG